MTREPLGPVVTVTGELSVATAPIIAAVLQSAVGLLLGDAAAGSGSVSQPQALTVDLAGAPPFTAPAWRRSAELTTFSAATAFGSSSWRFPRPCVGC